MTRHHARTVLCLLALPCFAFASLAKVSQVVAAPQPYVPQATTCDGFPRVAIGMAPGFCAGLVMSPAAGDFRHRQVKTPRMLLQLPDGRHWLLTDLGSWTAGQGKLWLVEVESPQQVHVKLLLGGLTMPHTVALGPDGKIYVAEMNRIFRLDMGAADAHATTVVDGLPGNRLHPGRHPLSHFEFDRNGDLLVNVGADTDQCTDKTGAPLGPTCPESEGENARGVIRRYVYLGQGRWDPAPKVIARGLRNSLVLVRHSSGTILQGENSYDFAPNEDRPYDEINIIRPDAHYGWPYCYDMSQSTPAWASSKAMDCNSPAHQRPVALLPPHAAPLAAVYYAGSMFPALKGKLLMSWHGYRPTGSRIVAFDVDAVGVPLIHANASYPEYSAGGVIFKPYGAGPAAEPLVVTPGWDLQAGSRPAGAPVGITVAQDGSLWVPDDRNAAILRIAADRQ
jgi:glucose/arabinose dehydrogenase